MFVNVDVCEIVFITSEKADYEFFAAIFIELLKFDVKCYCFGMDTYVW